MDENMSTPFYATAPRRQRWWRQHDVGIKIYDTNGKVMVNGGGWTRIWGENNNGGKQFAYVFRCAGKRNRARPKPGTFERVRDGHAGN
jgi:type 1 fimbria pilin